MPNFTGTWRNQLNSTLVLQDASGKLQGKFESGVGDDGTTLWVPVEGRALGDVMTFNAVYPQYGTVISWVGQHTTNDNGDELLKVMWLHASNVNDNEEQGWLWYSNRIGSDVFRKVPTSGSQGSSST